jgi:hypothetical protein
MYHKREEVSKRGTKTRTSLAANAAVAANASEREQNRNHK